MTLTLTAILYAIALLLAYALCRTASDSEDW